MAKLTPSKARGELKRLARRIAKSYGHSVGAWEDYDYHEDGDDFYAACPCGAMVALHREEGAENQWFIAIGSEIVERCKNAEADTGRTE